MAGLIAAVYEDLETATDVLQALVDAGTRRHEISLAARDETREYSQIIEGHTDTDETDGENVADGEGTGTGALIGTLTGLVTALGPLEVRGIGRVIAAGPLMAALAGGPARGSAGAMSGSMVTALADLGVPAPDAEVYAEAVRRGGVLVGVDAAAYDVAATAEIMDEYAPIDIAVSEAKWREHGWEDFDESTPADAGGDLRGGL